MRYIIVCTLLWVVASAWPASATGLCENVQRRYSSEVSWSQMEKRLAFKGTQDWCEEKMDDGAMDAEVRGTLAFVEIRDMQNEVVERLASARGKDAARLREEIGAFRYVPKTAVTLKERGFTQILSKAISPVGGCTAQLNWVPSSEKQNGFPAAKVRIEVKQRKKIMATQELGLAARMRRVEMALRTLFLADEKAVVVWARVPQCVGGPPPGYWGKDDAGTCYAGDELVIRVLTAQAHPELAGCFEAITN